MSKLGLILGAVIVAIVAAFVLLKSKKADIAAAAATASGTDTISGLADPDKYVATPPTYLPPGTIPEGYTYTPGTNWTPPSFDIAPLVTRAPEVAVTNPVYVGAPILVKPEVVMTAPDGSTVQMLQSNEGAGGAAFVATGNSGTVINPQNTSAQAVMNTIVANMGYTTMAAYLDRNNPAFIQSGGDLRLADKNALYTYFATGGVNSVTAVDANTVNVRFYHPYSFDANDQMYLSPTYFPEPPGFKVVDYTEPTPASGMYQIITLRRV